MAINDQDARMYTTFCFDFNLKPEWLGKTFTDNGKTYTISGLNTRSKKFPVMTKEGTRFNAEYLIAVLTNTVDEHNKKRQQAHEKEMEAMLKKARAAFSAIPQYYNIPSSWLDKTFKDGRKTYKLIGYNVASRSYPFVAQSTDGKVAFFTHTLLLERIEKTEKAA